MAYLYKNKPIKIKGREAVATAEKVAQKHRTLSGYHFIITIAYPTWQELDDKIRLAVLDHELEHCFVEDDEKTGEPKYAVLPHDVEEFSTIIRRHGLYTSDLVRIGHVVQDALDSLDKNVVVKKLNTDEEEDKGKGKKKKIKKLKKIKKHHHHEDDDDDLV
jgi:DNA-binding FrmR family transcriptional regulator